MFAFLNDLETPLVRRVASLEATRGVRLLMLVATRGADGWALLVIIPAWLATSWGRGLAASVCACVSGPLTALAVHVVKVALRRQRPADVPLARPITARDLHAFPSGHTAHTWGIMVLAFWVAPWLGLAMVPFAFAVGASRVFFGLHYPTDVVAGALLGVGIAWQAVLVAEWIGLVGMVQ